MKPRTHPRRGRPPPVPAHLQVPLGTPAAVVEAALPLEDLLVGTNHVPIIAMYPVIAVNTRGSGQLVETAQAVYDEALVQGDAGCHGRRPSCRARFGGFRVRAVTAIDPAQDWRVWFLETVDGLLTPAYDRAGTLSESIDHVEDIADLVESRLGPVRHAGEIDSVGEDEVHRGLGTWEDLLLITDDWATILNLGVSD